MEIDSPGKQLWLALNAANGIREERAHDGWDRLREGTRKVYEDAAVLVRACFAQEQIILATTVRQEVLKFALLMEEKLRKHDGDRGPTGWKGDAPWPLYERMEEEWGGEFYHAIKKGVPDEIAREAADVANFAMMIADVSGGLK